jgi:cytochrome P450
LETWVWESHSTASSTHDITRGLLCFSISLKPLRLLPLVELPTPAKTKTDHYQQIVDKVQRPLEWELERPAIMSHIINKNGKIGLPIGEINATFMVLTTAGSERAATVLSGTLNYLVTHPDKLAILVEEVRKPFQSADEITLHAAPYGISLTSIPSSVRA